MNDEKKREIPPLLRKVLAVDAYFTDLFVKKSQRILFFRQLQVHNKTLEVTINGILWLAGWLAFIWVLDQKSLYQMQVNFYIGLLLDIIIIAIIKSIARRRKPISKDDKPESEKSKYSFPSGHASRAAFCAYYFIKIWTLPLIFIPSVLAWTISVCISKIVTLKHYILDVIAGVMLGLLLGMFIDYIYLSEETCKYIVFWITDEKLEGGEYHV